MCFRWVVRNRALKGIFMVLFCVLLTGGCESTHKIASEPPSQLLKGYLALKDLPNSVVLIPKVPGPDSAEFALDREMSHYFIKLKGTERWYLAIADANLHFPEAAGTFSCSLNAPISKAETPILYRMLQKTVIDAGLSTYNAKDEYERVRPFIQNKLPSCTPEEEARLKYSGSYPSGHTAIGWAWALILSNMAPDRADKIKLRGKAFGESRMVCNVHWNSDVLAGRTVGTAVVEKLFSNQEFLSDLALAKEELAMIRKKNLPPTRDCMAESDALAIKLELTVQPD